MLEPSQRSVELYGSLETFLLQDYLYKPYGTCITVSEITNFFYLFLSRNAGNILFLFYCYSTYEPFALLFSLLINPNSRFYPADISNLAFTIIAFFPPFSLCFRCYFIAFAIFLYCFFHLLFNPNCTGRGQK